VRPAAGPAGHGELLDAERVGDRGDVADTVHDPSSAMPRGRAVAGPVVGHQPDPQLAHRFFVRMAAEP
jgi:hypothetical protein